MYFCPCSCNDPVDPETEENAFFALPRNLSYVQESYLDRYSVSARFVHNPKIERSIIHQQNQERRANVEDETSSLLSAIRAQEFPVRSESCFDSVSSPAVLMSQAGSSTDPRLGVCSKDSTLTTGVWSSSVASSPFTRASLLEPASRVASKLSSFLHSPPNESMDAARHFGTSVDADCTEEPEEVSRVEETKSEEPGPASVMECPQSLGEEMDRGSQVKFVARYDSRDSDGSELNVAGGTVDATGDDDVKGGGGVQELEEEVEAMDVPETSVSPPPRPFGHGGKTHFPKPELSESGQQEKSSVSKSTLGTSYGSPDSDGFSEEGVFLNMDDLESTEKSTSVSEASDDTCVSADSLLRSPADVELEDDNGKRGSGSRKMTLEEAISRAASDLSKISLEMYGSGERLPGSETTESQDEEEESKSSASKFKSLGRSSPVRGLKILIQQDPSAGSQTQLEDSQSTQDTESPIYPDNEFNFSRVELRKSSSLKTNKTPPGTPHRKKVVRFADAMGLDLESVRHVLNMESPPKIPASAMAYLQEGLSEDRKEVGSKYLCPCFAQPGAADNFVQRVVTQKVSLENAIITDLTITGFVRVSNISYHKSVRVRYTHNSWSTFHDIAASYVLNSCDGPTDRFSFSIVAPAYFVPGCRLEFAVSFNAGGVEYWDNNDGNNYCFECFAKTVPTDSETAWLHFL